MAKRKKSKEQTAYERLSAKWRREVMNDPLIGGRNFKKAMRVIACARDTLVPMRQRAKFNKMLRVTGVGDHPAFLRLLYNFGVQYTPYGMFPHHLDDR